MINSRIKSSLFASLVFITVMLPLVLSCTEDRQPPAQKNTNDIAAPNFILKDLTGRNFQLSAKRGKPVLLIFTTTWCPTCRTEMPHYKSIYETYGPKGLEVVNIDVQEQKERVSQFSAKYHIPYRILLDEDGDVAGAYGITGVPAMVLIDKDGRVLSRQYLAIDTILETLLGKN